MPEVIAEDAIRVLDHGFVRLDDVMASDLSVVNGARVSFARHKSEMDEADEGLIRFLMRDRHGTPFEHNAFRFHIRAPIFVAREWFRHRIGCLTGDTEITFVDTNGSTSPKCRKTIDDLWRMWTQGERDDQALTRAQAGEVDRLAAEGKSMREIARTVGIGRRSVKSRLLGKSANRDARWRVRGMRLRVLNEETGELESGHIADIFDKGIQPVYRLTLADGKQLTLTENHRLLTTDGWMRMGNAVGLIHDNHDIRMTRDVRLMTNGVEAYKDREWLAARNFWRGGVASERASIGRWTREQARKVHEQYVYTCRSCDRCGGRLHAHHIVPVWLDKSQARDVGNLITLCDACHRKVHRTLTSELAFARDYSEWSGFAQDITAPERRGRVLTAHPVRVIAIEYVGMRQTFDLSVEGPWHNFIANGVVVHNSFNEFSMRYAKATDDFYVPEPDDVRTQVGKPGAYSFDPVSDEVAETTRDELRAVYDAAFAAYERLVELGVARELARCVMPVGAYTEFYWTVNARALMNFISLRAAESAQREIRRYAEACEHFFAESMPVTHAAFVAANRVAP
jgi:thymidylate synthase ThyX